MKFQKHLANNEANLVAKLYTNLRVSGYECYLEYPLPITTKCKKTGGRIDMAIVQDGQIVCLVEVKNARGWTGAMWINKSNAQTKQLKKYAEHGIPLIYCSGLSGIKDAYNKVIEKFKI